MNGIVPGNLDQIAAEVREKAVRQQLRRTPGPESNGNAEPDPTGLTDESTPRVLSRAEVVEMDSDELKSGLANGRFKLS